MDPEQDPGLENSLRFTEFTEIRKFVILYFFNSYGLGLENKKEFFFIMFRLISCPLDPES